MIEKQAWDKKRNWILMRLVGAKSIFTSENTAFMEDATNMNQVAIYRCEDAVTELIRIMKRTTY